MDNKENNQEISFITDEQKNILAAFDKEPKINLKPINPLDEPIGILDGVDDPDTADPLYEYNHEYNKKQRLTEAWNKPMIQAMQTWLNLTHKAEIEDAIVDGTLRAELLDEFLSSKEGQDFGWETRPKAEMPFVYDPNEKVIDKSKSKNVAGIPAEAIAAAKNTFTNTIVLCFRQALSKAFSASAKAAAPTVVNDDDSITDSSEELSQDDIDELSKYVDDDTVEKMKAAANKAVQVQQFTQDDINNSKYIDLFDATVHFLKNTLGKRLMIVAGGPGLGKSYTIADAVDTVLNGGQPGLFKKVVQTEQFYPIIQSAIPTSGATRGKKDRFLYKRGGESFNLANFVDWMFSHRANFCCVFDDADKYLLTNSGACQNLLKGYFADGEPAKVDWSSEQQQMAEESIMSFDVDKLREEAVLDMYNDDRLILSEKVRSRKELKELCDEFGLKPTKEAISVVKKLEEATGTVLPDDDDDINFDTSSFDPSSDNDANIAGDDVVNARAEDPIDDMFEEEEAAFNSSTAKSYHKRVPNSFAFSSRIMFITNANERKLTSNPNSSAVYQRSYHVNMDLTKAEFMARLNSIRPYLAKETKKTHEDVIVEAAKKVVWTIYGLASAKPDVVVPFIFSGDESAFNRNKGRCKIDGLVQPAMSFRVFESLVNSLTLQIDTTIQKGFTNPEIESGESEDDYLNRLGMSGVRYNDYQWFKSQVVPCFKLSFQGLKKEKGDI